ncbi:predicted protein [Candida tropicalis MYA-3404]|uniref:Uncharacterized protein n=1 Tax=Candida tropicalis (strain ATCC MYA-3404 / T1) TaxID=294747 RepID=C5M6I3_CANTT|nr:predicted protein [Candida tropicalis MYA-3404]EER34603.1 predicted protein [Candida tropicalis MYA-3404]KAG4408477.1 hypothetical protein JTP64_001783 [Candida tropicalis]
MTTSTTYLTKDSLFLKLPTEPTTNSITLKDLYNDLSANPISYDSIINKTYYLLKSSLSSSPSSELTVQTCLKLWQIRLTCHLFNNNLNYAKKESINLNNSLYLNENHNISPSSLNTISGGANGNNNLLYPLPKNNLMVIDYKLLILLMRLKNFPNLNLTNELYKLIWQIRLKSNNSPQDDTNDMNIILENLSFDNIVILIITKNFIPLINFLNQLIEELKELNKSKENQYYSNICLIYIIINLIVYCKKGKLGGIFDNVKQLWENDVNQFTKNCLNYSLQKISPIITQSNPSESIHKCETIDDLVELVNNDLITGRIICSTLGIWDLINNYDFTLAESEDGLQFRGKTSANKDISSLSDEDLANECLKVLESQWCKYINKVYGLE